MANQSVIVVGITLIWQKAVAAIHIIAMKLYWHYLKFRGQTKNHQATKLKALPNILRVRYGTYIHTYCKYCSEIKYTTSTMILKFIICAVSNKFSIVQNLRDSSM